MNKIHNIDGPAIIWADGTQVYYVNDKIHRIGGPAKIWSDGIQEYWVDDIQYTKEQYPQAVLKYKLKQLLA
jgi:hypothetical protein